MLKVVIFPAASSRTLAMSSAEGDTVNLVSMVLTIDPLLEEEIVLTSHNITVASELSCMSAIQKYIYIASVWENINSYISFL